MKKYTLLENGTYRNNETKVSGIRPGSWLFQEVQEWLDAGNIPDPEFTQEEIEEKKFKDKLQTLENTMVSEINLPATCTYNNVILQMDIKYDSAIRLKSAIDLAIMLGETNVDIVDYNNEVHTLTLEEAKEINKQQALAYRNIYMTRAKKRDALIKSKS